MLLRKITFCLKSIFLKGNFLGNRYYFVGVFAILVFCVGTLLGLCDMSWLLLCLFVNICLSLAMLFWIYDSNYCDNIVISFAHLIIYGTLSVYFMGFEDLKPFIFDRFTTSLPHLPHLYHMLSLWIMWKCGW